MHGHGIFNWWGFSPAADLLNYVQADGESRGTKQILMIGAGDPRHILKILAGSRRKLKLKVFVLEAQVELYARMILLLGVSLRKGLGVKERATLLLDLWGNLTLRPTTKEYLESAAREYAMAATDTSKYDHIVGMVSAVRLKYRERDAMDDTFRSWYKLKNNQYDPANAWDVRLRQLLKTRYDNRGAEADWAWHMRLSSRIEHLFSPPEDNKNANQDPRKQGTGKTPNLDGYVGVGAGWGHEFLQWRNSGHAFDVAVQTKTDLPNTSLASVGIINDGCKRHRRVGYWGDLLTGPFPALALASASDDLIKLQNGRSKYSGTEVAQWNQERLLDSLWHGEQMEAGDMKYSKETETNLETTNDERNETKDDKEGKRELQQTEKATEKERTEDEDEKRSSDKEWKSGSNEEVSFRDTKLEINTISGSTSNTNSVDETGRGTTADHTREPSSLLQTDNTEGNTRKAKNEGDEVLEDKCTTGTESPRDETHCSNTYNNSTQNKNAELPDLELPDVSDDTGKLKEQNGYLDTHQFSTEVPLKVSGNNNRIDVRNYRDDNDDENDIFSCQDLNTGSQEEEDDKQQNKLDSAYLHIDGVEVILLSPTQMKDLESLSEISGHVDVVYLSAATAHMLTPKLASNHISSHTTLLIETARMMPELTDAQVNEYETRVITSAREAGWEPSAPAPICHLLFNRKSEMRS